MAFGVPDTDDRALRLICSKHGRRWLISGPINADIGKTITIKMIAATSARTFKSKVGEDGNGPNYAIEVGPDDDAIHTLMAGKPLRFEALGYHWAVPAVGAAKVLGPLLKHCTAR